MKIDYISDLHLDFHIKSLDNRPKNIRRMRSLLKSYNMSGGDVIIIAGDIGHYNSQNIIFLNILKEVYNHVIVVLGNHDHYLISKNSQLKYNLSYKNRVREFKELCSANDIILLDGETVTIDDITFGGFCGWWDKSYFNKITETQAADVTLLQHYDINDAKYILDGERTSFKYLGNMFKEMTSFDPFAKFREEYNKLQSFDKVDIMISHFPPVVPLNMPDKYKNDYISTFYNFDGISEVNRLKPKYWVFGHNHYDCDFVINETNFLCSPLGYPGEKVSQCKSISYGRL